MVVTSMLRTWNVSLMIWKITKPNYSLLNSGWNKVSLLQVWKLYMRNSQRGTSAPVDKEVDFAQYFRGYSFLHEQKHMLSDRVRMDAYFNAVFQNKHHFEGKTVLDVGTGSGILAIWSAQAGARKVYAVEATKMADHARSLVKANKLDHIVEVIEGTVEDISLPEKVDVIISEWMGYFLMRESMFDSVISARDRWLKPTGVMYPSHARMWLAPIKTDMADRKRNDFDGEMANWHSFSDEIKTHYGVDMGVLTKHFAEEQEKYYIQTAMWDLLNPQQIIGTPTIVKEMDCLTASASEIQEVRSNVSSVINAQNTRLCGFGGWFDVQFLGRKEDPAQQEIELTTAPSEQHCTHWGQQVFIMSSPINVEEGDNLNLGLVMSRSKENHRRLEVELSCEIKGKQPKTISTFSIQYFHTQTIAIGKI